MLRNILYESEKFSFLPLDYYLDVYNLFSNFTSIKVLAYLGG